jgi:basic membrane protein A
VLVGYSQNFTAADKCKTVATNLISQGADVLFQVAGGCGLGTLKAADEAGKWGIGVDKDQYNDAKRVLTSAFKRVDNGVFTIAQQEKSGKFKGGTDTAFNLANGAIGLGKINPAVPKASLATANKFKAQIIAGKLKVPTAL